MGLMLVVLFLGCATTGEEARLEPRAVVTEKPAGDDEESGERTGEASVTSTQETAEASSVTVDSSPEDAEVFLNNSYSGTTPLTLEDLKPGTYLLTVRKSGYYTVTRWIDVEAEQRLELAFTLERITGYLDIDVAQEDPVIIVDGSRRNSATLELPVGVHRVRIRKFGYQDAERTVVIKERQTTRVKLDLNPATFTVEDLALSRSVVNPRNPGRLGEVVARFRVTAPGSGRIRVRNAADEIVWARDIGPFETWEQQVRWPAELRDGRPAPEGRYRITVAAEGSEPEAPEARAEASLRVSSAALIRYRSLWSGASGALYAPSAEVLPRSSVQLSVFAGAHEAPELLSGTLRVPTQLGLRFGLGADLELDLTGTAYLYNVSESNRYQGTVALKWQALRTELGGDRAETGDAGEGQTTRPERHFSLGALLRGTYHSRTGRNGFAAPDTLTDFAGFSAAFPADLRVGPARLIVAPELHYGYARVTYDAPTSRDEDPGLWAYGRAGMLFDIGALSLGASAALRSTPFDTAFALDPPAALGAEAHWLIPGTLLELSGFAAAEVGPKRDFTVLAGGGLGLIY
jgi:hypothetical protein